MAKFTLGCYTAKGLAGFVSNPHDEKCNISFSCLGAKVTQYSPKRKI